MKKQLLTCAFLVLVAPWSSLSVSAQEVQKPVADLLDVEFGEDGMAVDVSPMEMVVEQCGTAATAYSKEFGRYIATFANKYSGDASGYYRVNFGDNDEFMAALADGHTLEMLVMADYDGNIPNAEAKPFAAHEQGGTGFLVSGISDARQNEITFLPNVTTNGNSTWRWATSGVVPQTKMYYHVVGVWNKEEQKAYVYVDGVQRNCVDAQGEWRKAVNNCNWFCIGGDASTGTPTNSWCGNVVLARAYDKPLSQAEVAVLWDEVKDQELAANVAGYREIHAAGTAYVADVVATKSLKDAYEAQLDALAAAITSGDMDAMATAAQQLKEARIPLADAARAYESLATKVRLLKEYLEQHPDIAGAEFDEVQKYMNTNVAPGDEFANGSYLYIMEQQQLTIEEINSEVAWLTERQNYLSTLAAELPVADLLDVEFEEGGTAVDRSPMKMTVEQCGTAATVYSQSFGRYIASFENPYAGSANGYYRIDFENNEAFVNALKDGHTLEALIMADYSGAIPNSEAKPFSAHQAGGTGFLISTTSGSRKNEITFLPNISTSGGSTWRWATSGVVPQPRIYYHIVGVWNKEEQKAYIYVDGVQKNCVDAPGEWHMASAGCNWFAIGGDADNGNAGNSWPGNVVLARVYDKALTMGEVALLWNEVKNQERDANNELYINQIEEGYAYLETIETATQADIDAYTEALDLAKAIIDGEEEGDQYALYNEIKQLRANLSASVAAYARYKDQINYVNLYLEEHNDFAGADRDYLESYLTEEMAAEGDYPRGTYSYIWDQHTMTTQEIDAETEWVKEMLAKAIENGYVIGSEITNMLTNPNFNDGFNGWQGALMSSAVKSPHCDIIGAEAWAKGCNMYQSLEGLQDGVYAVQVNGAYRPFNDPYSNYHAARLNVNENRVFLPTAFESMVPVDKAENGTNCYIEAEGADLNLDFELYDESGLIGYAINGRVGIANAANGGRALNTMVANVTDGKLTIGFENPNEKSDKDWMGIANLHVFYLGSLDQASQWLDQTLDGQAARARTIINNECSTGADYAQNPGCPREIKDQLAQAIQDIDACKNAEEKYQLIGRFGQLFDLYMEGRAAYVAMAQNAEYYLTLAGTKFENGQISSSLYDDIYEAYEQIFAIFADGDYSIEEALEMKIMKDFAEMLEGEFVEPKADLLDVVFNADGTAYDQSPRQMTVERRGNVEVNYSDTYSRYMPHFQAGWAQGNVANYYRINFEDDQDYRNALADGHSLEILIKAEYTGNIANAEAKPFAAHEGGGTGFLISTTSGARQNEITFLPNVTTNGNSTWRWATSGIVPQNGTYYHVVGVWNKEEQKAYVYVNGECRNTVDAQGDLKFASGGNNWFAIGGDPTGGSNCANSWNGEVGIARVYDQPLDRRQVAFLYKHVADNPDAIGSIKEDTRVTHAVNGTYTINGIRIQHPTKGLYIINGKKIFVK